MEHTSNKIKKLLLEYELLTINLDESSSLYEKYESEFLKEVKRYIEENDVEVNKEDSIQAETSDEGEVPVGDSDCDSDDRRSLSVEKSRIPKSIKSIYKKIATKTHPDKIMNKDDEDKILLGDLYKRSQDAMNNSNLIELLKIAKQLNINIDDIDDSELENIYSSMDTIKSKISSFQKKYPWIWHTSKSDDIKAKCIEEFVKANAGVLSRLF